MAIDFQFAAWGMFFAGLMYVIGNGTWANYIVRRKPWLGWFIWSASAIILWLVASAFEARLDPNAAVINGVDIENYWITGTLYALMSIPGASSVLLKQNMQWTRLALLLPAIIVFIPIGQQLANPENNYLLLSLGTTAGVCALLLTWQKLLDSEPAEGKKA